MYLHFPLLEKDTFIEESKPKVLHDSIFFFKQIVKRDLWIHITYIHLGIAKIIAKSFSCHKVRSGQHYQIHRIFIRISHFSLTGIWFYWTTRSMPHAHGTPIKLCALMCTSIHIHTYIHTFIHTYVQYTYILLYHTVILKTVLWRQANGSSDPNSNKHMCIITYMHTYIGRRVACYEDQLMKATPGMLFAQWGVLRYHLCSCCGVPGDYVCMYICSVCMYARY